MTGRPRQQQPTAAQGVGNRSFKATLRRGRGSADSSRSQNPLSRAIRLILVVGLATWVNPKAGVWWDSPLGRLSSTGAWSSAAVLRRRDLSGKMRMP